MGFLNARRAQKAQEEQERLAGIASRQQLESAEGRFKDEFASWLSRLESVHVELGGPALSDETLRKAGPFPVPNTAGLLRHHVIEINAFARSFADSFLERRRLQATTAGNRQFYGDVAQFANSVLG